MNANSSRKGRRQEFRSSGVQEFRSSGVQEFRSSGVAGVAGVPGVAGVQESGVRSQEFRSAGRSSIG